MNSEQQKAMNHVQSTWGNKPCPCCGSSNWGLKDKISVMPHVKDQGINLNSGYPFIIATCSNCAYSIFFNAVDAGVY